MENYILIEEFVTGIGSVVITTLVVIQAWLLLFESLKIKLSISKCMFMVKNISFYTIIRLPLLFSLLYSTTLSFSFTVEPQIHNLHSNGDKSDIQTEDSTPAVSHPHDTNP